MLSCGISCIATSVMIVMTVYIANLLFLILKLFLLHIPEVLIEIVHAIVVQVFQRENVNNEIVNADSDDSTYDTAEEETSDDFLDADQYVHGDLPPNALGFHPMSSLYGISYQWVFSPIRYELDDSDISYETAEEPVAECHESKVTCEEILSYAIQNEWVSIPLKSDSNASFVFEPTEQIVTECRESKESVEQVLHSESVDVLLSGNSSNFFEPIKQQVIDFRESKEICVQPLINEIRSQSVEVPLREDSSSLIEPTEQRVSEPSESKKTWKQRLLCRITRNRDSNPKSSSESTGHSESKKAWKLRYLCCISTKTDD